MAKDFNQPDNENYLSPVGFKFIVQSLPKVQWFVQTVNLPGLSLPEVITPSPLLDTYIPGDNLVFEPLSVSFLVDEDMTNWVEVYNWLRGLSSPENSSEYSNFRNSNITTSGVASPTSREAIYSDATLIILNSNMNPKHQILFKELFPTNISTLNFSTIAGDIDYITADVTFRYSSYTYEKI